MSHDEILQAAKEAGLVPVDNHIGMKILWWSVSAEELERFASIIEKRTIELCASIIEKRTIERCAVVCEMLRDLQIYADKQEAQNDCATAIRKLGEQ